MHANQIVYVIQVSKVVCGISLLPHTMLVCETYEKITDQQKCIERKIQNEKGKRTRCIETIKSAEDIHIIIEYKKCFFIKERILIDSIPIIR